MCVCVCEPGCSWQCAKGCLRCQQPLHMNAPAIHCTPTGALPDSGPLVTSDPPAAALCRRLHCRPSPPAGLGMEPFPTAPWPPTWPAAAPVGRVPPAMAGLARQGWGLQLGAAGVCTMAQCCSSPGQASATTGVAIITRLPQQVKGGGRGMGWGKGAGGTQGANMVSA